jgi:sugar transferase (PEP-CTERM/EpsH1 system associated)
MSAAAPLVIHVVNRFAVGGLENGVVNLINRLPREAWRHMVVALTDIDPAFASRVTREDVQMLALHKQPGHPWGLYPALYRLFRRERPAIVHSRNLAALDATIPAWAAGVPVRLHGEHGRDFADPDGRNVRRQWLRRAYRPFVTRYIALSPDLEHYLVGPVGIPPQRVEQICNGVDTVRFRPAAARAPIPGCPFVDPEQWLVGTVGRLDAVKDQGNLAAAFVTAVQRSPEARRHLRLVVVGEGPVRADVEAILQAAGVRNLAWLAGERHDIPAILQGLDCFVLPSLAEGVSNTVLEAMATGLPVVATRVGANPDLVAEGVTGRLVAAADSDALAEAILTLFADRRQALDFGRAGRLRVEQRFSLDRMVERYHRTYAGLLTTAAIAGSSDGAGVPGGPASR